jgi:hypothetical protein
MQSVSDTTSKIIIISIFLNILSLENIKNGNKNCNNKKMYFQRLIVILNNQEIFI